jgi:hypothetical protein
MVAFGTLCTSPAAPPPAAPPISTDACRCARMPSLYPYLSPHANTVQAYELTGLRGEACDDTGRVADDHELRLHPEGAHPDVAGAGGGDHQQVGDLRFLGECDPPDRQEDTRPSL